MFEPAAAIGVSFSPYQHLVTSETNTVRKRAKEGQEEEEAESKKAGKVHTYWSKREPKTEHKRQRGCQTKRVSSPCIKLRSIDEGGFVM